MTNWESLNILSEVIQIFLANLRPIIRVLYYASLFKAKNLNLKECSNRSPFGFCRQIQPHFFKRLKIHRDSFSTSSVTTVNSTTKTARIWDFIAILGIFLMSYAPNSVAHNAILLVKLRLCKIA